MKGDLSGRPGYNCAEVLTVAKRKQQQVAKRMNRTVLVADPEICHGQPTFRGTRILVADVMEQVLGAVCWETIRAGWRGDVSPMPLRKRYDWRARAVSRSFRSVHGTGISAPAGPA